MHYILVDGSEVALLGLLEVDHVPDGVEVLQKRKNGERKVSETGRTSTLTFKYWR